MENVSEWNGTVEQMHIVRKYIYIDLYCQNCVDVIKILFGILIINRKLCPSNSDNTNSRNNRNKKIIYLLIMHTKAFLCQYIKLFNFHYACYFILSQLISFFVLLVVIGILFTVLINKREIFWSETKQKSLTVVGNYYI